MIELTIGEFAFVVFLISSFIGFIIGYIFGRQG